MSTARLQSRPMRALAAVLGAWITMRLLVLFPIGAAVPPPAVAPAKAVTVASPSVSEAVPPIRIAALLGPIQTRRADMVARWPAVRERARRVITPLRPTTLPTLPVARLTAEAPAPDLPTTEAAAPGLAQPFATLVNTASASGRLRLSGSVWAIARPGGGRNSLASGGQLGGSQVGARLYVASARGPLALTALASAPLAQEKGKYGAVGLALRGRTVGVIVEHRVALDDGARSAVAVTAYGGVYDVKLAEDVKLDGYVQAGTVGGDGFVDGAVRVERTVLESGGSRLSLGGGAWGGAQTGASRLDVGPQIVAHVPAANASLRISAEWRERVAGDAQPGSGFSISAGLDF